MKSLRSCIVFYIFTSLLFLTSCHVTDSGKLTLIDQDEICLLYPCDDQHDFISSAELIPNPVSPGDSLKFICHLKAGVDSTQFNFYWAVPVDSNGTVIPLNRTVFNTMTPDSIGTYKASISLTDTSGTSILDSWTVNFEVE